VTVVGVGKVGADLVGRLVTDGCEVLIADINTDAVRAVVKRYSVTPVDMANALETPCDILSPAALGGVLNQQSIRSLRCRAVVGAANNQLANPGVDAKLLREVGILYAPDFVVNAGGLINIAEEIGGYDAERAAVAVNRIGDTVRGIIGFAEEQDIDTHRAALRVAKARIDRLEDPLVDGEDDGMRTGATQPY
jgi:glutamate dehydrogenase/leucine dehydrogenase